MPRVIVFSLGSENIRNHLITCRIGLFFTDVWLVKWSAPMFCLAGEMEWTNLLFGLLNE